MAGEKEIVVTILGFRWFGMLILLAAVTGHLHCGSCGFERDYVGDVIDGR